MLSACAALIERALQEGWSLVLEGVHLVPGMLPPVEGALVVHCVLAIEDEQLHESHFWVRDASSDGLRPVQKYLDALGDIRVVQDFIVDQARSAGVPVVENGSIELSIGTVMELVLSSAERCTSLMAIEASVDAGRRRAARPVLLRDVPAGDRAGRARGRALARARRPGERRGGRVLGDARRRSTSCRSAGRVVIGAGDARRLATGTRRRRRRARSTSRSTRSRAAASSRAAATARSR